MQKIISLFQRNHETDHLVRNEIVPGAEWVLAGEGHATRKLDGTCAMVKDVIIFKRYEARNGKKPPIGFAPAQDPDPVTGHWPGWLQISETDAADKYFREARDMPCWPLPDGTYELLGPKVQGNAEKVDCHSLISHKNETLHIDDVPRTFDGLKEWFKDKDIEGVVWHHPDGRMVKIKKKDFGMKR